jgi:LPS O-antigen subunit length determinant protein (WzzB/FepE family)
MKYKSHREVVRSPSSEEEEKKKKKKRFILFFILLFAILLIVGGFLLKQNYRPNAVLSGAFPDPAAAQKMNKEQLKKYAQDVVDKSKVTINVYPEVIIQEDGVHGSLWVQNLPTNTTGQQAILKDKESGKVLYKSGLLEPGYEVKTCELSEKLSKGTHKGLMMIEFYDLKTQKTKGQTSVDVNISVK